MAKRRPHKRKQSKKKPLSESTAGDRHLLDSFSDLDIEAWHYLKVHKPDGRRNSGVKGRARYFQGFFSAAAKSLAPWITARA